MMMTDTSDRPPFLLYLAPMKGFTDQVFRNVFAAHWTGLDVAVAPFISSRRDRKIKPAHLKDVLLENNTRLPVIPQILSNTAEDFAAMANCLYDLGHPVANLNLGCPFPTVTKKKRGAGLLPHTDRITAFLDQAVPVLKGRMSIKIRLGWDSPDDLSRLLPVFRQYPLAELIVHPRLAVQRYEGSVDLETFEQMIPEVTCHLVYNGDIRILDDFKRLSARFPTIDRWMIGRGCLENPFLPAIIKAGASAMPDKISRMKAFHDDLFEAYSQALYGPAPVFNKMKGFWQYYAVTFNDSPRIMKKIKKSRHPEEYLAQAARFFEAQAAGEAS